MAKKLTIEYVRSQFKAESYILLSGEYINNNTKLLYKCNVGHRHDITYSSWVSGARCAICSGNKKNTIEDAKRLLEKEGYKLLSKHYKNARSLLNYECPKGHIHKISLDNFKRGYRCPYCNGRPIITLEEVNKTFKSEEYTLLSKEYVSNKGHLKYMCPEGHVNSMCLSAFKNGHRCPTCASIKFTGPGHPNWKGGLSYEPYCLIWGDKEYKADIRERDGNRCLNPSCDRKNSKLCIHHIDYNKKNCSPSNLITVCMSCNSKANYDRDWHTFWYKAILNSRYNYGC